jgi:hypothetical protein
MTIPEACQLVLQASAIGKGGQICVLDMGQPVKIVDLAKNLILLSGLRPDEDIKIEFTGMRPGEKLYTKSSAHSLKTRFQPDTRKSASSWVTACWRETSKAGGNQGQKSIRGEF